MGDDGTDGEDAAAPAPALQVIVLGSGGGPDETNTTAFLVRSLASGWGKGSLVAVDAGVHLGAINRILESTQPAGLANGSVALPHTLESGPFKGLELPHASPNANAAHILRSLVDTYLITHPHLDHIAGFVINTAGLPGTRPKRLAGLPSTIAAFKAHIFNNVIWPNLSDENNGAGLVTYNRLVEGGSPALGDGDGRGYLEISDGLAVKVWGVSHGHCIEKHSHRGSGSSTRFGSLDGSSMGTIGMGGGGGSNAAFAGGLSGLLSPRSLAHHNSASPSLSLFLQQQAAARGELAAAGMQTPMHAGAGGPGGGSMGPAAAAAARNSVSMLSTQGESVCVYDSSAYFVRDVATGREVLIFGDVEPDSVSLSPRNAIVWAEAAPKIAAGKLVAIFIECSYDDSQTVDRLFGHLTPRYIDQEMSCLAAEVAAARAAAAREGRKRKRQAEGSMDDVVAGGSGIGAGVGASPGGGVANRRKTRGSSRQRHSGGAAADDPVSPKTVKPARGSSSGEDNTQVQYGSRASVQVQVLTTPSAATATTNYHGLPQQQHPYQSHILDSPHLATPTAELSLKESDFSLLSGGRHNSVGGGSDAVLGAGASSFSAAGDLLQQHQPLKGLKVVIIHVKDRMDDKTPTGEVIMQELAAHESESRLGCEYVLSSFGQSMYF